MKSTNDNRPLVEFSDIVKELHSYANSEQAVDDFVSELLKIVNLQEEFNLSQSYFSDDKTNNYLRKKTNLKSIILSGINKRTSSFKNLRTDFVDTYQDYFDKNITGGNPFVNTVRMLFDFNLYYDIKKKRFVIYEGKVCDTSGSSTFYSRKDFSGTYVNCVETIFPVSFSTKKQNSNLLLLRGLSGLDDLPRNIDCESDLLFLKYISGIIDIKEFSAEYLKDINFYIEKSVDNYLNLSKEIRQDNILASYPAEIFTEDEIVKYIENQLFDSERYNYISGVFDNRGENEYVCSLLEKILDPSITDGSKILSLIASDPHFEFEKLPGLKSKDKKGLILKLMKKSRGEVPLILLDYFDKEDLYQMFKNTVIYQLKKMVNNKKIADEKTSYLLIGGKIVYFDYIIPDIVLNKEQVAELKREVIPLLEQVQEKVFLKVEINGAVAPEGSKSNKERVFDTIYSYQSKIEFYYNLCKLVDWYPQKIRILSEQGSKLNCFGLLSYINELKKKFGLDIEYTFFIKEDSSIKSEKDLFGILDESFDDVTVLFEKNLSAGKLKDFKLRKSYGTVVRFTSTTLSY